MPHHALRHKRFGHQEMLLRALHVLIRANPAMTRPELIAHAIEIDSSGEAAAFLSAPQCEGLSSITAWAQLSASWTATGERNTMALEKWARGRKVVLILPLPPHVCDMFRDVDDLSVLNPDDHHVHHLRRHVRVVERRGECRARVQEADLIAFDAYRDDDEVVARPSVVDLMGDLRVLKPGVRFAVHYRPDRDLDEDDEPLPPAVAAKLEEL